MRNVNGSGHSEPTGASADGHDDHDDDEINEDTGIVPPSPRPSSPISSLPTSSIPSSPRAQHQHATPPPPRVRRERTTPLVSSPPHVRSECTNPPSSPRSELTRDSLRLSRRYIVLPPAPFREGYTPGPKPKAADYEDGVERTLLNAMHEYACLILSTDAFPNEAKQTQWAKATWRAACEEVGEHYECSVRMIRLVRFPHHFTL